MFYTYESNLLFKTRWNRKPINYAYVQNNVVIYSDLIKVKIALDNGEVLGIESTGYLNNHTTREYLKCKKKLVKKMQKRH